MKVTSPATCSHTDKADRMGKKPAEAADREGTQAPPPPLVRTIEIAPTTTAAVGELGHQVSQDEKPTGDKPTPEQSATDGTRSSGRTAPRTVLVIDVGGTKVKMMATGQTEPIKFPSGRK